MKAKTQKNSVTKLVSLIGVASASVFLALPALALANSNSSSFDSSLNKRDRRVESTGRSGQLLAQGTSGTGGTGTGGTGAGQTGTGGTGAGQTGTGGTGAGQAGTGGTGAGQTGTGGTGAGQAGTGGTGTGQGGTGGTGTGQGGTGGTGAGQANGQQDAFTQYMNAGYTATQLRDYQTALAYFQRALQLRPNNPYATRAVSNVQGYLRRGTTTPTNQGNQ